MTSRTKTTRQGAREVLRDAMRRRLDELVQEPSDGQCRRECRHESCERRPAGDDQGMKQDEAGEPVHDIKWVGYSREKPQDRAVFEPVLQRHHRDEDAERGKVRTIERNQAVLGTVVRRGLRWLDAARRR